MLRMAVTITYDSTRVPGSRIRSARLSNGSVIQDDAQYKLILNDFLATGGDGLAVISGAIRTDILNTIDVDALVEYLRTQPQPVRAPSEARIVAVPPTP